MTDLSRSKILVFKVLLGILTAVPGAAMAESSDPCANAGSQQAQSHCANRDNANHTGTIETVKGVINYAGAAVNIGLFAWGMSSGTDLSKVCDSYTFGVNGANIGWDVAAQATMQDNMQATAGSIGSLASFGPQVKNATKEGLEFGIKGEPVKSKKGSSDKASSKEVAGANSACLINAGTLGATGATNTITASGARQGANAENAVIAPLVQAEQSAYSFPTSHSTGSTAGAYNEGAGSAAQSCMGLSGQAFLSCLGNSDPSLSSLLSNSKLKDLKGYKNLDSILKSAIQSGDANAIKNAASALSGASPAGMEKLMKASEEAVQKNALAGKGAKSGPAAKSKSKNSPDPKDPNYDKLLKDMMDKLANGNPAAPTDAQAELQERQMDLMTAEQIEARSDISLFHRVAFRYKRKALDAGRIPAKDPAQ